MMRTKFMVVAIVLILIIPINFNSTNSHFKSSDENQVDDRIEFDFVDRNVEKLLSNAPTAFTENQGQLENDNIRFYVQGGGLWFTDDGVWFELREEIKGQESRVESQKTLLIGWKEWNH